MNEYDTGKKPLSYDEKEKRDTIREQKNKYLQVAMMDPDVYNDDKLFEYLIAKSDDYNAHLEHYSSFMYIDEINDAEYFKENFQKQIDMVKKVYNHINVDTYDYITKID